MKILLTVERFERLKNVVCRQARGSVCGPKERFLRSGTYQSLHGDLLPTFSSLIYQSDISKQVHQDTITQHNFDEEAKNMPLQHHTTSRMRYDRNS